MANFIVIAILAVVVFFAARSVYKSAKRGGCCGDCSACGGCCHSCTDEKSKN